MNTSSEKTFSVKEAAELCGVSRNTIYRRREQLLEQGAEQTGTGLRIPFRTLISVGLAPRTSPTREQMEQSQNERGTENGTRNNETVEQPRTVDNSAVKALEAQLKELQVELMDTQKRLYETRAERDVARAEAEERNRLIEAQEHHLRLLTASVAPIASAKESTAPEPQEEPVAEPGERVERVETSPEPQVHTAKEEPVEKTVETPKRGFWSRLTGR